MASTASPSANPARTLAQRLFTQAGACFDRSLLIGNLGDRIPATNSPSTTAGFCEGYRGKLRAARQGILWPGGRNNWAYLSCRANRSWGPILLTSRYLPPA